MVVKFDSKIKFGKIFNASSEFPEDVPVQDSKETKSEDFNLLIKKDPELEIKPEHLPDD